MNVLAFGAGALLLMAGCPGLACIVWLFGLMAGDA